MMTVLVYKFIFFVDLQDMQPIDSFVGGFTHALVKASEE